MTDLVLFRTDSRCEVSIARGVGRNSGRFVISITGDDMDNSGEGYPQRVDLWIEDAVDIARAIISHVEGPQ